MAIPNYAAGSTLTIALPKRFDLPRAVCSYGYFLLAPNNWVSSERTLYRPLHGSGDRLIHTAITVKDGAPPRLILRCDRRVDRGEGRSLKAQVSRMLRLDESFGVWHKLHPQARRARFDRMFRSPSLFEDLIKTITGCNVTWPNTMRMNVLLCEHVGGGGFPTPSQLARVRVDTLKRRCKVGYRAERIVRAARQVVRGELDLSTFEDQCKTTDQVFRKLTGIYGIGEYAAANLCQLIGRYDRLPIDSETYRHFRQDLDTPTPDNPKTLHSRIESHYARYAPYQFMAYWFDLWWAYQKRFGDARRWEAHTHGTNFTANRLTQEES